jgi:hypothetical protein
VPVKNLLSGATNGVWDWDTDTIKVALCTSAYTPDQDTHDFFNDVTNEITGTGYTAGGVTTTTPTVTYDTATDEIRLDCDDPSWSSATFTARVAVWYKSTGTASTSPLIGYMDFGADQSVSSGAFTIQLDSTGAFKADAT